MLSSVVWRPTSTCTGVFPGKPPITLPFGASRRRPAIPSGKTTVARPITSEGSVTVGDALGSRVAVGSGVAVARAVAVALAVGTADGAVVLVAGAVGGTTVLG